MQFKSFETERLIIKPTTEDDAAFILALVNSPKWLQNIGDRNVRTLDDASAYITNKAVAQRDRLGYSNFTLIRKKDQVKLGTCGLFDREGIEGVDIGFALLPAFEKQGYAYEAASKIIELAVKEFAIEKISAITLKENVASQALLKKIGLTFSKFIFIPNDPEELMLFEYNRNLA